MGDLSSSANESAEISEFVTKLSEDGESVPNKEDLPDVDWLTFSDSRRRKRFIRDEYWEKANIRLRRSSSRQRHAKAYMKSFAISANELNEALG